MEDEGIYECSFVFSGYIIEGSSYNISITMNASGKRIIIIYDKVRIIIYMLLSNYLFILMLLIILTLSS